MDLEMEVKRLRQKVAQQRRELRHLHAIHRLKKYERYAKKISEAHDTFRDGLAAIRDLTGDKAWQAGMHFGMKLARGILKDKLPAEVLESLNYEIGWRFEGVPIRREGGASLMPDGRAVMERMPKNCQSEPPYLGADTVVYGIRSDSVCHRARRDCPEETPHPADSCGALSHLEDPSLA